MEKEQTQESTQLNEAAAGASSNGSGAENIEDEFYTSGRTGRRNAMPDILGNNCTASSGGDLPDKLSALTTNGKIRTYDDNRGNQSLNFLINHCL